MLSASALFLCYVKSLFCFFSRKSPNVTVVNGRMYVTASEDNEYCDPLIEVYDPSDDRWASYTSTLGWKPANSSASKVYKGILPEVFHYYITLVIYWCIFTI